MGLLDSLHGKGPPPERERVTFDDEAVTRRMVDGSTETVRWDELEEVWILTTDEGPFVEDVYWMLVAGEGKGGCAVPQGAEGSDRLLERLQQLPGFDNDAVIAAMGSTDNARFVCWRRGE
jgi:hypothetical protein